MRRNLWVVAAALWLTATVSWAQTNAFLVSFKGNITQQDGTKVAIKDASALIESNGNVLVLIVSQTDNAFEIDEVTPGATNQIFRGIGSDFGFANALLDSGKFSAAMFANGDGPDASTDFVSGVPSFNGDLHIDGKIIRGTPGGASAKLVGTWKGTNEEPLEDAPSVFKGSLKTTGPTTVPENCCFGF